MLEMLGSFLNPDYQESAIALLLTWTSQPKMTSGYASIDRLRANETQDKRSHPRARMVARWTNTLYQSHASEPCAVRYIAWLDAFGAAVWRLTEWFAFTTE
ncbi:MAG: hypothetical protein V7K26_21560 [Nostoc sp.]|uniref:hypothetical protein n=1 Tax=Nostoc sp. TaxID=1180 RepID=UPI002FEF4FFD